MITTITFLVRMQWLAFVLCSIVSWAMIIAFAVPANWLALNGVKEHCLYLVTVHSLLLKNISTVDVHCCLWFLFTDVCCLFLFCMFHYCSLMRMHQNYQLKTTVVCSVFQISPKVFDVNRSFEVCVCVCVCVCVRARVRASVSVSVYMYVGTYWL